MLQQLYPPGGQKFDLNGLYLALNLHHRAAEGEVLIYANYIQSLDGRIALPDEETGESAVPAFIANGRDWRLYQELAGQCDIMITSARYFRQLAKGCAQDLLPVGVSPDYGDIRSFRKQQGLKAQPDVMILSDSLEIPLESLAALDDRNIIVLTTNKGNREKINKLEAAGATVVQAETELSGHFIRQTLTMRGYRSAYMIAGPKVHHTLAVDGSIDELFLTTHLSLLGGSNFDAILDATMPAIRMKLLSLYFDESEGQLLMRYQYQKGIR